MKDSRGLLDATTDEETIQRWWTEHPSANIGLVTDGLLVIDLDPDEQGRPNAWLADDPDKLLALSAAPLSITPRMGRHFIFRQPAGKAYRNTAGKLAPHVDTRADGGYILVPPSVLDGGRHYRWGEGMALDCERCNLPEPPAWLISMLEDLSNGALPSSRLNQVQQSNAIPSGQRNQTLASMAGALRRIGFSQAEICVALQQVNQDRCNPPMTPSEVDKIAWSIARCEPDQIAVALVEHHAEQMVAEFPPEPGIVNPGPFPCELLQVPGFIGQVMAHNLAGAFKPQPVLALGAALALLSVLTGRKIADPFGTRTNLYCLGVCQSGGGKERAREVNKEICFRAGQELLIGPEGFASHAGIVSAVERQPAILFQLDEIGRLIETLGDASRSPHLFHIATVLMKLFTSSGSLYMSDAYADSQRNKTIIQPHAVIYGTTVPKSLYEGLTAESLTDGFLSRMLIFESNDHDPEPQMVTPPELPAEIIEGARFWGDFRPNGGNLSSIHPTPRIVPYTSEAHAVMAELEELSRKERRGTQEAIATMWTRTTEKARKLALLYACSANAQEPMVNGAAAEWAAKVSQYLTRKMLSIGSEWIAESPYDAKCKRMMRAIAAAGSVGLSKTQLNSQARRITSRERLEILHDLMSRGEVLSVERKTRGRSEQRYLARAHVGETQETSCTSSAPT